MKRSVHLVFPIPYRDLIEAYEEGFDDHEEAEGRTVREEVLDDLIYINEMKIYIGDEPTLNKDFMGAVVTVPDLDLKDIPREIYTGLTAPTEADQTEAGRALVKRHEWTYKMYPNSHV